MVEQDETRGTLDPSSPTSVAMTCAVVRLPGLNRQALPTKSERTERKSPVVALNSAENVIHAQRHHFPLGERNPWDQISSWPKSILFYYGNFNQTKAALSA